jgi:hypothetical protein
MFWTIGGVIAIALAPLLAVRIARKRRAEAAAEGETPADPAV